MITIMQGERFKLESAGNGAVYLLTDMAAGRDVILQGDDALQFETDLESVELMCPNEPVDFILRELWDQCAYGDASQPIEKV